MALWFDLHVNDESIATFYARRRDQFLPEDRVCTYDVQVAGAGGPPQHLVVRHPYDEGALALVHIALGKYLRGETDG